MARPSSVPELTAEEKQILEQRVRASVTPHRDSLRTRTVLVRAEGLSQPEVTRRRPINRPSLHQWSQRLDRDGLAGGRNRPRPGRALSVPASIGQRVIEAASQDRQDPRGRARWSVRALAAPPGIAQGSAARIRRSKNLKPHLRRTCKLSNDPQFKAKFREATACTATRPRSPSCSAATRKLSARPWNARSPARRWSEGTFAPRPTITSATARVRCAPR